MKAAVAALALAAPAAAAQEGGPSIEGAVVSGLALLDIDGAAQEIAVVREAQLTFGWEAAPGGARRWGLSVELDTEEDDGVVDESFLFAEGPWGLIELGEADGAGDQTLLTPAGCLFTCPGDDDGLLFDIYDEPAGGPPFDVDNDGLDSGDALKITWFTPEGSLGPLTGLRAGVSFSPADTSDLRASALRNAWSFVELGAEGGLPLTGLTGGDDDLLRVSAAFFDSEETPASWAAAAAATVGRWGASIRYAYQDGELDLDEGPQGGRAVRSDEHALSVSGGWEDGPLFAGVTVVTPLASAVREPGDYGLGAEFAMRLAPGAVAGLVFERADSSGRASVHAASLLLGLDF